MIYKFLAGKSPLIIGVRGFIYTALSGIAPVRWKYFFNFPTPQAALWRFFFSKPEVRRASLNEKIQTSNVH